MLKSFEYSGIKVSLVVLIYSFSISSYPEDLPDLSPLIAFEISDSVIFE